MNIWDFIRDFDNYHDYLCRNADAYQKRLPCDIPPISFYNMFGYHVPLYINKPLVAVRFKNKKSP